MRLLAGAFARRRGRDTRSAPTNAPSSDTIISRNAVKCFWGAVDVARATHLFELECGLASRGGSDRGQRTLQRVGTEAQSFRIVRFDRRTNLSQAAGIVGAKERDDFRQQSSIAAGVLQGCALIKDRQLPGGDGCCGFSRRRAATLGAGFNGGDHFLDIDRLRQIRIHPGGKAALTISLQSVSGQRDDRHMTAARRFVLSNGRGRFEPVHLRHLHVHQHHVEPFCRR